MMPTGFYLCILLRLNSRPLSKKNQDREVRLGPFISCITLTYFTMPAIALEKVLKIIQTVLTILQFAVSAFTGRNTEPEPDAE